MASKSILSSSTEADEEVQSSNLPAVLWDKPNRGGSIKASSKAKSPTTDACSAAIAAAFKSGTPVQRGDFSVDDLRSEYIKSYSRLMHAFLVTVFSRFNDFLDLER